MGCSPATRRSSACRSLRCSSSAAYAFVVTWVILKVINLFEPVRVPDEVEKRVSTSQLHGEDAYTFD